MAKRAGRKKKGVEPAAKGLTPAEVVSSTVPRDIQRLQEQVEADGGRVLCAFREPWGGHWAILAVLPIDRIEPTPFQRDLSGPHVSRLAMVIQETGRFLDPIIVVRTEEGRYWTPNGHHRLAAMKELGARSITALLLPEPEVAYLILALNTEKAHNIREKSLEVIRMAQELARLDSAKEREFTLQFDEPAYLTLGLCYLKQPRFSGGAYLSLLRRIDEFLDEPLREALKVREKRAEKLLGLDEKVMALVAALRERGITSPYLKSYVVARLSPLEKRRRTKAEFDKTIDAMRRKADRFDPSTVRLEDLALAGGAPEE
jgi:ParB family chromosome partitioning protein